MVEADASAITDAVWKCLPCGKTFKSEAQLDEHKRSKRHKRAEKAYAALHPDTDCSSFFKSITQSQASSVLESQSAKSDLPGLTVPENA